MSTKYEKPLIVPLKSDADETGMGVHCKTGSVADQQCDTGTGAAACKGGAVVV